MKVCVVGMGKIGLPLALAMAQGNPNNSVIGLDTNQELIEGLRRGHQSHVMEPGLHERLEDSLQRKAIFFSTDFSTVSQAQVIVVVVPLKLSETQEPNFDSLTSAFRKIGENISENCLVILETTVPVGTCRNLIIPIIEEYSKKQVGINFFFSFSPERVSSGNFFKNLSEYPKLIGAFDENSAKKTFAFYSTFISSKNKSTDSSVENISILSSIEAAEFTKLAESLYRDVNIALANALSQDCQKYQLDYFEIQKFANSQPFSNLHSPGIYVGGHCIPVYPYLYLAGIVNSSSKELIEKSRLINDTIHQNLLERALLLVKIPFDRKPRALVLGVSYRGGVKETYKSGVFEIVKYLQLRDYSCFVYDSQFTEGELVELGLTPTNSLRECFELIVINSDEQKFKHLTQHDFCGSPIIVDGRGILNPKKFSSGNLYVIGKGWN